VNDLVGPTPQPRIHCYTQQLTLKQAPHVAHPLLYVFLHWLIISYSPLSAIQYVYECRLIELYRTLKSRCTTSQCNVKGDVQKLFLRGRADLSQIESSRAVFISPNSRFAKCSLFEVAWPQELSLPPVAFHPQCAGCPMSPRSLHVPLTTRLPRSITRRRTKSGPRPSPRWTYQGHDLQKRQ
jgi:hypothetical protein